MSRSLFRSNSEWMVSLYLPMSVIEIAQIDSLKYMTDLGIVAMFSFIHFLRDSF